jgi:hypothetical protein
MDNYEIWYICRKTEGQVTFPGKFNAIQFFMDKVKELFLEPGAEVHLNDLRDDGKVLACWRNMDFDPGDNS